MTIEKLYHPCIFLIAGIIFLLASCDKEYSYEGGNTVPPVVVVPVDTILPSDTIHIDPGALPNCPACNNNNDVAEGYWRFKTGNSILCGKVDTSFMLSLEKNVFTFFGPSNCGADTGIIFTVNLPASLNGDTTNVRASSAIFYYYHTNFPYVLLSHNDQPFYFMITSYVLSTKIATGVFSGPAFRADGRSVVVSDGKFKIKLL